jgi:hypothetical protein
MLLGKEPIWNETVEAQGAKIVSIAAARLDGEASERRP